MGMGHDNGQFYKQLFRDFSIFDQKSANTALTTYYFTEN
jgi:hypothetical protein